MVSALMDSPLLREDLLPLKSTSEYGANVSYATIRRWADAGCRSVVNGTVVVLESIYRGAHRYTSREAYLRFLRALNAEPVKPRRRRGPKRK